MRHASRIASLFLLVLGAHLAIGCGEKNTGPDGNAPSSPGQHMWSKRFGDDSTQAANAVAVDASGNVIIVGYFRGAVDFGGGALASAGGWDIFVAKFGSDGAPLWSKRIGDQSNQGASAVAVDASGNVTVAGYFEGTVNFGGGALTSAGLHDIFVAKFGSDGAHLWSKRFGDSYNQYAEAAAIDASGNVVITGVFESAVDFGGGVLTSAGAEDIFVAKFGSDGAHLWSTRFGDGSNQIARAVAVDAPGSVIVTGDFEGAVDFGGGVLTSAGGTDIFVAKFGSDGAHLWSKRFGDGSNQVARAVAVDAPGSVIVTGHIQGTADFGGGTLTSAGLHDIFVAKFGSTGAHLWSKRFGDGSIQAANAVAIDPSGTIIVTGDFYDTVDFGGGALTSAGNCDIFIAKFDSDGAHLWSKRFGDGDYQFFCSVAVDASGSAIITGFFRGAVDFGGGALTCAREEDIFAAKFGP